MAIIFKLTTAGRQALVNAKQDGTSARTLVSVGITAAAFTPTDSLAAIPGEIKRIETLSGDVSAKDTIHVTVRDDGDQTYTVRGLGLYLDNGVLLGSYSQANVILEKSAASTFLLSTDLRVLDGSVDISTLQFGDSNFINPPATTERQGVVELADQEEAGRLQDKTKALTPHSVKPLFDGKAAAGHGHDSATQTVAGFMSADDKKKLDGIAAEANKYAHPTGDGNQHIPATGTGNNGKVLMAGATAGSAAWQTPLGLGTSSTTAAKGDHVHGDATQTVAGFMSADDKKKLDGIAAEANKYAHPAGDGNQHVPATGTGNNGKVLMAGATAGSAAWQTPLGLGTSSTSAAKGDHVHGAATQTVAGFMSADDKKKLDGIAAEANKYAHPTGDGNLHVPATGTGNSGKVLMAGATAGSASWQTPLMEGTYDSVPTVYKTWMIAVVKPHLRVMVWDGSKYVRAPWHQPGMVLYSYDNPASIPGYLPVRADVVYQKADYPDLAARLGLTGTGTFALVEARGEFLRVLDNGRGVDANRALRSAQGDAIRNIAGRIASNPGTAYQFFGEGPFSEVSGALDVEMRTGTAFADATTATTVGAALIFNASKSGIPTTDPVSGENRPKNLAFPVWLSY